MQLDVTVADLGVLGNQPPECISDPIAYARSTLRQSDRATDGMRTASMNAKTAPEDVQDLENLAKTEFI